jgi:hypothetical protein
LLYAILIKAVKGNNKRGFIFILYNLITNEKIEVVLLIMPFDFFKDFFNNLL